MKDLGKGIATVGIWIGVGMVARYGDPAVIFVGLFAVMATLFVWG